MADFDMRSLRVAVFLLLVIVAGIGAGLQWLWGRVTP